VGDVRLADAIRAILLRPQPFAPPIQRIFRTGEPLELDPESAAALGGSYALLVPFLEAGSTAAVIPIATPAEVLASFTILSLDSERPITEATLDTALAIASQAALAIDNARLYQQQKEFSDTMQRSLLPRARPQIAGLEIGDVYAPSSRVEVGGDVYDFLELDDGRLAVVLGDVTGHGIDATADMAMAKFVFRSLAREHPEPGDFLAYANDVVVDEIAAGKFITMAYLVIDPAGGVAYASAGHPAPRLVHPDGRVESLDARGLPLGIEPAQEYLAVRAQMPPGSAVVVYTDGVVEARLAGELYGTDRLDARLKARLADDADTIARAVLEDCRAFGGGELTDDCALVVVKRS
jgi:serine phosphatase RsbU (regulator of sigma subunit)